MTESADRADWDLGPPPCDDAAVEREVTGRVQALAMAVVLRAHSELGDGPSLTIDSWTVGESVVILLRYRCLQSMRARSVRAARRHHVGLTSPITAAIDEIAGGRLELRGSSFSAHRCLSAFAFGLRKLAPASLAATQVASPTR
jgi:hypothetical protein